MAKLVFIMSFISMAVWAAGSSTCQNYNSEHLGRPVRYCVHRSNTNAVIDNQPVIYFFHGLGGGAGDWVNTGFQQKLMRLMDEFKNVGIAVVSFDTNARSFFSDFNNDNKGGRAFESWFTTEFVRFIEREYKVCSERQCRATFGISMGGFGALKTALKYPERFVSAAAHCPALPPFSIFDDEKKWEEYFDKYQVGSIVGLGFLRDIRAIFVNRGNFLANSPVELVKNWMAGTEIPKMYFDVGGRDYFGFNEGYDVFKAQLDEKGILFKSDRHPNAQNETNYDPNADHDIYRNISVRAGEAARPNEFGLHFTLRKLLNK